MNYYSPRAGNPRITTWFSIDSREIVPYTKAVDVGFLEGELNVTIQANIALSETTKGRPLARPFASLGPVRTTGDTTHADPTEAPG